MLSNTKAKNETTKTPDKDATTTTTAYIATYAPKTPKDTGHTTLHAPDPTGKEDVHVSYYPDGRENYLFHSITKAPVKGRNVAPHLDAKYEGAPTSIVAFRGIPFIQTYSKLSIGQRFPLAY